jgi:pimeloyl-ACP methyl ester carboxylesterase/DNA-binding CsgD family transcriptional regulator
MAAEPAIQFLTLPDGARLAYVVRGEGMALVRPPGWLSVVGAHVDNAPEAEFAEALAAATPPWMQVSYHKQGTGLSDRHRTDFSLESHVRELEAVVDHLRLDRFALFCASGAGCIGIAYAARHPERVTRIIFAGAFARGESAITPQMCDALVTLVEAGWEVASETLAMLFFPDGSREMVEWIGRVQREAATPEMAAALFRACLQYDVADLLPRVTAPCLVLHRRGDRLIRFNAGVELASGLPNARFTPIEGSSHPVWDGRANIVREAILEFLHQESPPGPTVASPRAPTAETALTRRQMQVLRLIAQGRSSREIATELTLSERTIQRHISELYTRIGAHNRAEATAFALRLARS